MADFLGGGNDFDEFERAVSAFPDISLDGSGDIPSVPAPHTSNHNNSGGFSFDDFEMPSAPSGGNVKITGDDEIEKFENEFPEIEVAPAPPVQSPPSQPSFTSPTPFAPRPQPSAFASTPISLSQAVEEEPEVIKQWREKQQEEIKARDEASKEKRQETISKAERSLEDFYEDYSRKKERNIADNKDTEADYIASLEASLAGGTTWVRICDLIELENSQSKTIARTGAGTTDLTRFREALLRLRRQGDQAPGAAGY